MTAVCNPGLELDRIYNVDCMEGMKLIPDKSIDMIFCDLPYGTTKCRWDIALDLGQLWAEYNRIIKDNSAILLFAQTPFDKVLGCSNLKMLRYEWVWEKSEASGHLNVQKMPLKAHENILVFIRNYLHITHKKLQATLRFTPSRSMSKPKIALRSTAAQRKK